MEKACEGALSLAQVCRNLGLKPAGSNYHTVKSNLDKFGIDVSYFTGQKWNKGLKHIDKTSRYSLEDILQENINYKSSDLKERLVATSLKKNECEVCGYAENLELHHINGNSYDNRLENLQILCPNCHAKTDNFRGRNSTKNSTPENLSKKYSKSHYCICKNCGKEFYSDRTDRIRKFCSRECYNQYVIKLRTDTNIEPLQKSNLQPITKELLEQHIINCNSIEALAKCLNTSRTTVRKYLKEFDLYENFRAKYDFHSKPVIQYDITGSLIKEWPSITDAAATLGIDDGGITKCCNYRQRSCGGYLWKYKIA